MRIRVYRNLTHGGYSVQNTKTNLVVGRYQELLILNPKFVVRPGGRERVLKERVKNVHAFVVAENYSCSVEDGFWNERTKYTNKVTYQPYERDYFIDSHGNRVDSAEAVLMNRFGIFI